MPNFFPEGNTPLPTDSEERSLLKAVSLLETIASGGGGGGGGGGHSGSTFYEIKSANFTAEIGKNYAVDTTAGVVSVTLPTNPQAGEIVGFADAKGTWGTNAITILRNGKNIEGSEINFSNNASGTFFVVLFIDNTTGWRVLTSGTKPLNLNPPTVSGTYEFTSTNGTWTGSPTSFSYQWQMSTNGTSGWANINGATSSTYTGLEADEGKYVRIGVIATNSNGPSVVTYSAASAAINLPDFPTSGLLAFWGLNDNGSGGLLLTDSSGNGNTLTNNNAVILNSGKVGGAARVSAVSGQRLTRSDISLPSTFTISCWVKVISSTSTGQFFGAFGTGATSGPNIDLIVADDLNAWVFLSGPFLNIGQTDVQLVLGAWNHMVVTVSTSAVTWYFNNSLVDAYTGNYNHSSIGMCLNTATYSLAVGDMVVDSVGVWNRVLTAEERALLYNSGNGVEL